MALLRGFRARSLRFIALCLVPLAPSGCATVGKAQAQNGGTAQSGDATVITTVNLGGTTTIYNIGAPKIELCRKELDRRGFKYEQTEFLREAKRGGADVKLFLDCGMRPDAEDAAIGGSALGLASRSGQEPIVRQLLDAGATVNLRYGESQRTALLDAAAAGDLPIIELLLARKADPKLTESPSGVGALVEAARSNHGAVIRRLLAADASLATTQGPGACTAALEHGSFDAARALAGAGTCTAEGPSPQSPNRVSLALAGETMAPDGPLPLRSGDTLRSGDRFSLRVHVGEPAYVYLALARSGGERQILFPATGDERIDAGAPRRVPRPGRFLELDDQAGVENIVVYASRSAVPRADVERWLAAEGGAAAAAKDGAPPEVTTVRFIVRHDP